MSRSRPVSHGPTRQRSPVDAAGLLVTDPYQSQRVWMGFRLEAEPPTHHRPSGHSKVSDKAHIAIFGRALIASGLGQADPISPPGTHHFIYIYIYTFRLYAGHGLLENLRAELWRFRLSQAYACQHTTPTLSASEAAVDFTCRVESRHLPLWRGARCKHLSPTACAPSVLCGLQASFTTWLWQRWQSHPFANQLLCYDDRSQQIDLQVYRRHQD